MNGAQTYPLAPAAWGAGLELRVDDSVQALLFSVTPDNYGTAYLDVALEADPLTRGWRVRNADAVIGRLGPQQRSHFPSLERVHASGLTPHTLAGVRLDAETGRFVVDVYLPPEQFCVPHNNSPADSPVLPPGDMMVVDTTAGEFTAEELMARSPGQWLVGLTVIGDAAVATLDSRVLGTVADLSLDSDAAAQQMYARAHFLDGMVGLDVATGETAEAQPLPALSAPLPQPEHSWRMTTFPDGTWAVLVPRDDAVDEQDLVHPSTTARHVAGPSETTETAENAEIPAPPPSIDFTPTTSFRASSRTFLTEVEKLRLLREQDLSARRGRHRR